MPVQIKLFIAFLWVISPTTWFASHMQNKKILSSILLGISAYVGNMNKILMAIVKRNEGKRKMRPRYSSFQQFIFHLGHTYVSFSLLLFYTPVFYTFFLLYTFKMIRVQVEFVQDIDDSLQSTPPSFVALGNNLFFFPGKYYYINGQWNWCAFTSAIGAAAESSYVVC